jgi:hypothetical protein
MDRYVKLFRHSMSKILIVFSEFSNFTELGMITTFE